MYEIGIYENDGFIKLLALGSLGCKVIYFLTYRYYIDGFIVEGKYYYYEF